MSNDNYLQQAVLSELRWDPSVTAANIGVTAKAGVVALTGHVESFLEKHAAETAARRVKGVKAVAEEIEVRLPFDIKRGDEEIAKAAVDRLAWNVSVPSNAIGVTVENGWLTLTGHVEWHFQAEAAQHDVGGLYGVRGITNQIAIKPQVNPLSVSDDIMHALHRSWFFDGQTVNVKADGGKITLTGSVHTPHERNLAASTAWAAAGTTSVENEIVIV
jgi:osmotically-inducible protein OsmY